MSSVEIENLAGEHADNAKLYEIVKGFSIQIIIIATFVILSVSEKSYNIISCITL